MATKITITKPDLNVVEGVSAKSGKPYKLRIQTGYLHSVGDDGVVCDFPDKFEFILADGQEAYARGHYTLSPSAIQVSRDGRLETRVRLLPLTAAAAK